MGQHVHKILEINEEESLGLCRSCGWTSIRKKDGYWRCRASTQRWTGSQYQRRIYTQYKKNFCERAECTATIESPVQLDVHHRDGNKKNNDPLNLVTLCANCHRLDHFG